MQEPISPETKPQIETPDASQVFVANLLARGLSDLIRSCNTIDLSKPDQVLVVRVAADATQHEIAMLQQSLAILCQEAHIRGAILKGNMDMSTIPELEGLLNKIETTGCSCDSVGYTCKIHELIKQLRSVFETKTALTTKQEE